MLQDCNLVCRKTNFERGTKNQFLNHSQIFGNTFTCINVSWNFLHFSKRKEASHTNQTHNMHEEKVFLITTFDGRAMYKEIIEATRGNH